MNDLAYLDPPIEVLASGNRLEMIFSRLKAGRMRPFRAELPLAADSSEPMLVDVASLDDTMLRDLSDQMHRVNRPVMILGDVSPDIPFENAVIISRDRDLTVLRGRLDALIRRGCRSAEISLRAETAAEFDVHLPSRMDQTVPDLLYLGDGSPRFLELQAALSDRGISVTAAFSVHTAADYLKQKGFTAILVDITANSLNFSRLLEWVSGASHGTDASPFFGILDKKLNASAEVDALLQQMAQIFEQTIPARALAAHIEADGRQVGSYGIDPITLQLPDAIRSPVGDLFSEEFFRAHLSRQIRHSRARAEPLTIMSLRDPDHATMSRDELEKISACLVKCLRETDVACLVGADSFVVSLPATSYRDTVKISERLFAQFREELPGLSRRLGWRIVEQRAYHQADALISEAMSGVFQKPRIA